jgi:hypothetical protein
MYAVEQYTKGIAVYAPGASSPPAGHLRRIPASDGPLEGPSAAAYRPQALMTSLSMEILHNGVGFGSVCKRSLASSLICFARALYLLIRVHLACSFPCNAAALGVVSCEFLCNTRETLAMDRCVCNAIALPSSCM